MRHKEFKILMIAPQPFYSDRGTPMNVKLLCNVLGEAGHQVDLLVLPTGKDVELKNTRIVRLPNIFMVKFIPVGASLIKLAYDILMIPAVFWLVITNRYDVIHGIEEGGFIAVILSKLCGKPSIFDMDSSIPEQLNYSGFVKNHVLLSLIQYIEKWSLRKSSCIITVCKALSDKARQLSPQSKIFQIEDVPIPNLNKSGNMNIDELIRRYKLENTAQFLYTGNLESYQGIDLLLDAWETFCFEKNKLKKHNLVIVGGTESQIDHYKQIASKKGIQESVCWVGRRPIEEMEEWMRMSYALVSPRTDGENTPLKIYSYMSSGRPIIATRRKTHTQVLDDSMAFLADPDPIQFSKAIFDVLNNPKLADQKAKKAKKIVEKNYNYRTFQRKLLKAYASIN